MIVTADRSTSIFMSRITAGLTQTQFAALVKLRLLKKLT